MCQKYYCQTDTSPVFFLSQLYNRILGSPEVNVSLPNEVESIIIQKPQGCYLCPRVKHPMTKYPCVQCTKAICTQIVRDDQGLGW
jgi:hypothetical protein